MRRALSDLLCIPCVEAKWCFMAVSLQLGTMDTVFRGYSNDTWYTQLAGPAGHSPLMAGHIHCHYHGQPIINGWSWPIITPGLQLQILPRSGQWWNKSLFNSSLPSLQYFPPNVYVVSAVPSVCCFKYGILLGNNSLLLFSLIIMTTNTISLCKTLLFIIMWFSPYFKISAQFPFRHEQFFSALITMHV